MASMEEENKMLKLNWLKKTAGQDHDFRKQLDSLESEILKDLGNKTREIKILAKLVKTSKRGITKANNTIGEMNTKMKLREEEIHLLEEKIMSLQNTIK